MCKIVDCEKKLFGRGMCSQHYFREKRAEDALLVSVEEDMERYGSRPDPNVDYDDFWEFVKKEVGIK